MKLIRDDVMWYNVLLIIECIISPFFQSGKTALLVAAGNGRSDVVKILIDGGANLEAKNNVSYWSFS